MRSLLAFWMGGACAVPHDGPPPDPVINGIFVDPEMAVVIKSEDGPEDFDPYKAVLIR